MSPSLAFARSEWIHAAGMQTVNERHLCDDDVPGTTLAKMVCSLAKRRH